MMAGNAPDALLHTVGHDSSAAPRRIALFSLGNFAGCDLVAGTLPLFIATFHRYRYCCHYQCHRAALHVHVALR